MSIKSSKVTIGILMSVALAGSASAQFLDDRYTPRVYGSLAVTPAQISEDAARITGTVPSRNVVVTPHSTTGQSQIIPSSTTSGSYSQSDVEAEARRVIAFQNATTSYTGPLSDTSQNTFSSERNYEITLFEPAAQTFASTEPVQSYATHNFTNAQSHYVDEGDTLYNVAKRYNTTVDALRSENGLSGNTIPIGQSLAIPSTSRHIVASNVGTSTQNTVSQSRVIRTVQPIPHNGIYAVLPKDTLWSISQRACVSVEAIQAQNGLGASTEISTGQRLTMPLGHCLY